MATLQNVCMEFLQEEGYRPSIDDDGDIMFKSQGSTLFICTYNDDDVYLKVMLPGFWSIESDQERAKVYYVANKVASEYKVAKVNVIKDNTYASCEIFISADDPQIKRIVGRLINILLGVRSDFAQYMNQ